MRFSLFLYILMLATSLSSQTSGVSLLIEGGLGKNDGSRPMGGTAAARIVTDFASVRKVNFFYSTGVFLQFTSDRFVYDTGLEVCRELLIGERRCWPDILVGHLTLTERRIQLGVGLRYHTRRFSFCLGANPSIRVATRQSLAAAKQSEFALIDWSSPLMASLQNETVYLRRTYRLRPNTNVQLQLSGNFDLRMGAHLTAGIGFRYDLLPYTLALENPSRDVPDAPLELDRMDVQAFAVLGALGWSF